jgi:hypothetical protein
MQDERKSSWLAQYETLAGFSIRDQTEQNIARDMQPSEPA